MRLLGSALALGLALAPTAAGALIQAGSLSTYPCPVTDVALASERAYVACGGWGLGGSGLRVLDVTRPDRPVELGRLQDAGEVGAVAALDRMVVIGDGLSLRTVDVSKPRRPRALGALALPARVDAIALSGTLAVVAVGSHGLRFVDVSLPRRPLEAGSFDTPGWASDVVVHGRIAYVADAEAGLRIVGFDDPAAPVELGAFDTAGRALGVAVIGALAYVADESSLRIVDVSDPAAPHEVGALELPDLGVSPSAMDVAVAGGLAFLAAGHSGVYAADVSAPGAPVELGILDTLTFASSITIAGPFAYLGQEDGIAIVDLRVPDHPREIARHSVAPAEAAGVVLKGGIAHLAHLRGGGSLVDVSDPEAPAELGAFAAPGLLTAVDLDGSRFCAAVREDPFETSEPGLHVVDVADPEHPAGAGFLPTPFPLDVDVAGDLAYVADSSDGLLIVDVSGAQPSVVGAFDPAGGAFSVLVEGPLAYVSMTGGLRILDVSDPSSPQPIGQPLAFGGGLAKVGSVLYASAGSLGLRLLDLSDPFLEPGFAPVPGYVYGVEVHDGLAFVDVDSHRLVMLDVSEPAAPEPLGALDAYGGVARAGRVVFVAHSDDGLRVFDLGPEYEERPVAIELSRVGDRIVATVFGASDLDAGEIDPASLALGPTRAAPRAPPELRDADRDGFGDLVARFRRKELGPSDTPLCLRGRLAGGTRFEGCAERD